MSGFAPEYGKMIANGIIDRTKVVRSAIQGAASVAGLLITTEAMVAEAKEESGDAGWRHARHGSLAAPEMRPPGIRLPEIAATERTCNRLIFKADQCIKGSFFHERNLNDESFFTSR
jgi:hypothetical protein